MKIILILHIFCATLLHAQILSSCTIGFYYTTCFHGVYTEYLKLERNSSTLDVWILQVM